MAKILVVDDDPDVVSMLALTLSSAGHDVSTEGDPRRAAAVLEEHHFDAVVLDVMMPGLSGWDLLDRLRSNPATQSVPLVMLSALDSASNRVRGLRSGADDYMGKPFEPDELVARVERLLKRAEGQVPSLQGRLDDYGLLYVAQTLEQSSKSGELRVESESIDGVVRLQGGVPTEARFGRLSGEPALRAMVELETGSFRFESTPESDSDLVPKERLSFGHVGMEVAWLRDELHRRSEFLPVGDQRLEILGDTPEVPEKFAQLPVAELIKTVRSGDATTLDELVGVILDAPTSIRLAVAWLVERGVVGREDTSTRVEGALGAFPESLDMALRELFQLAVLHEMPIDPVEVVHLVDPDAWGLLWPLLQRLPDRVLGSGGAARRLRLLAEKRGVLRIQHQSGSLRLRFETVRGDDEVAELPKGPAGVVLWLPATLEGYSMPALASRLAGEFRGETPLLVVASERERAAAESLLSGSPGWRLVVGKVATLERLVAELALVEAT